jgi:hypothetical protein
MHRVLLFVIACAAAGCEETQGEREIREYIADQSRQTHVCELHHTQMSPQMVPITFGYPTVGDEYAAATAQFPNAAAHYDGGCVVDRKLLKTKVPVYVCPECKRAERRWALAHPEVPEARDILAERDPIQPAGWVER